MEEIRQVTDTPDSSPLIDTEYLDPKTIEEIQEIKLRVEEWCNLHNHTCEQPGAEPEFSFRKTVYEDETVEIIVICDCCGNGEVVAVGERTPNGSEWSIIHADGLN